MASSEATETKTIITGLLISSPLRCTVAQLCKDFMNTVGYKIPFASLGFKSVEDYLRSIPDTVKIYGSGYSAEVEAVVKPKSAHINELVAKQKKTSIPHHKKGRIKRYVNLHQSPAPVFNQRYSLPLYTGESLVEPHLRPSCSNFVPQNSCFQESNYSDNYVSSVDQTASLSGSYKKKHKEYDKTVEKNCKPESDASLDYDDYETKVPPSIQNNLRKLILKFPNGLPCSKLLSEYQKLYKKKLYYEKFSYRSLIEMCSDLPEIFNYVQSGTDEYTLYDKNTPVPCLDQNEEKTEISSAHENVGGNILEELFKVDWASSLNFVPSDVLHLSDRIPRYFPQDLKVGDYLDVSIGEIYDISKFWVYETFGDLPKLMADLQAFFNSQRNKYLIPEFLLNVGLYCTTLYAGQYHRCVIVDLLPALANYVRVLFVDYGTVGNIPSKEFWYLPKQFGKIPCQAIRTRLSNIYPNYENRTWSVQAVNKFKQLVTNTPLVGEVTAIDKDDHVLEIYLADISDEENIFYINDKLVEERLALYIGEEQKKTLVDPNCTPVVKHIHLYPEFSELESGNAPIPSEMNYMVTNKIPLHHFMPHYFDIYYEEDIDYIEKQHEIFNKDITKVKMEPLDDEFDYAENFDYSLFPDELQEEIKDLVQQEMASNKGKTEKKDALLNEKGGENVANNSVTEYRCNKKRLSELWSGGSEKCNDSFSDVSKGLEASLDEVVPLNNMLQNVNLSNNDLSVINNVTRRNRSTNPFLVDEGLEDKNPFRATNPFLRDIQLDEAIGNTEELFEMYAKPKKVNNLNAANEIKKEVNVDNARSFSPSSKENRPERIRTPPGFHSVVARSTVTWQPDMLNSAYFNACYNNPHYQRFPQYNQMFNFTMQQGGVGNVPGFIQPYILPNQYQFNLQYFPTNFARQEPPAMNYRPYQP